MPVVVKEGRSSRKREKERARGRGQGSMVILKRISGAPGAVPRASWPARSSDIIVSEQHHRPASLLLSCPGVKPKSDI